MDTTKLDSAVGCTLRSMAPQYDAHRRVWIRGKIVGRNLTLLQNLNAKFVVHTTELFKNSNISAKSKPNLNIL